jgi:hypothetical protein
MLPKSFSSSEILTPLQPDEYALMYHPPRGQRVVLHTGTPMLQENVALHEIGQQFQVIDVGQKDQVTPQPVGFGKAPNSNQTVRLHAVPPPFLEIYSLLRMQQTLTRQQMSDWIGRLCATR